MDFEWAALWYVVHRLLMRANIESCTHQNTNANTLETRFRICSAKDDGNRFEV